MLLDNKIVLYHDNPTLRHMLLDNKNNKQSLTCVYINFTWVNVVLFILIYINKPELVMEVRQVFNIDGARVLVNPLNLLTLI